MDENMKPPVSIGDIIKTSYGTGPYIVIDITGPCTCPAYRDIINGRYDHLSAPHYHITGEKDNRKYYLNGYALDQDGKIKSIWLDDEIFITGYATYQLLLF
jgi:hypothetical protein